MNPDRLAAAVANSPVRLGYYADAEPGWAQWTSRTAMVSAAEWDALDGPARCPSAFLPINWRTGPPFAVPTALLVPLLESHDPERNPDANPTD